MKEPAYIPVFRHFANDNLLIDETQQLPYAAIPLIFQNLDLYFREYPFCLCLPFRNTVPFTILLMYLIEKKINFFLQSPNTSNQQVPAFCDQVITIRSANIPVYRLHENIGLVSNPLYKKRKKSIQPLSGAVILSSSGTSGPPKYVYHKVDKLVRNARNCTGRFDINIKSKVLIPVPCSHMYGLGAGLLPALLTGAGVHLIEKNNVIKLICTIKTFQPDTTLLTPVICKMLLRLNIKVPMCGKCITAGESISNDVYHQFVSRFGPLINLYGSTEVGAMATSDVNNNCLPLPGIHTMVELGGKNEIMCKTNSGFEYYLDKDGNRSDCLTYENGWYHTKDRGEMTSNRGFKILGRIDNCINRFGLLLSLRQVELELEAAFPQINEAIVIEGPGQQLVAICELKEGKTMNTVSAQTEFKTRVPKHYVPDEIRIIERMPRLANGKIDRMHLSLTMLDSIH